ncbi:MAG: hypothetical protein ACRDPV_13120 [Gaiellaceae bacterium]
MSSDEKTEPRDETESADEVVAHGYVADEPGEDDLERKRKRKRKRKQAEDTAGDELGRKRK